MGPVLGEEGEGRATKKARKKNSAEFCRKLGGASRAQSVPVYHFTASRKQIPVGGTWAPAPSTGQHLAGRCVSEVSLRDYWQH